MNGLSREMNDCIAQCFDCYSACLRASVSFKPGASTPDSHLALMLACAEICRTCAHFMIIGTLHHKHTCRECAEICLECAAACERIGGMQECVEACRACAKSCAEMAA
jgi:hypothetical protein